MDAFTLAFLIEEVRPSLYPSFLERIQQVGPRRLVLRFRRAKLLISIDDHHPTLYLIRSSAKPPAESASPFVLLAQKHLAGGRLEEFSQLDDDRIVRFHFRVGREPGSVQHASLVIELIDRRANAFLLDAEQRIVERCVDRRGDDRRPGQLYVPPRSGEKIAPQEVSRAQLQQFIDEAGSVEKALVRRVKGFGPMMAKEAAARAQQEDPYSAFQRLVAELSARQPTPHIYAPVPLDQIRPGRVDWRADLLLSPIRLRWPSQRGLTATPFASMVEAVETYERLVERIRSFQEQKRILLAALGQRRKKLERRRTQIARDMEQAEDYEQYRRFGELLLANARQAERRPTGFRVIDYYDPEQRLIDIPAAPHLTPEQAAAGYFQQYHKKKRRWEAAKQRAAQTEREWIELQRLFQRLEAADHLETLTSLREEILGAAPTEAPTTPKGKRRGQKLPGIWRYWSSERREIWVGRSAEANERLTFRLARPHDIWLHAADYPGSHVILRKAKGEPLPFPSLVEAAELAAFFSQARREGKVVVHYTERKYVHKVRGGTPGLVRLAEFKSITVEPRVRVKRIDE
ncbi:MAG: fibronectin-binding domain-containing protein [Acidobacteria bacterium]|nr:MAG: fibronectin-binding domain-containing protein [Acidobacteriota bacterium]